MCNVGNSRSDVIHISTEIIFYSFISINILRKPDGLDYNASIVFIFSEERTKTRWLQEKIVTDVC